MRVETLLANAFAYGGMIISLAGVRAKRDIQKWCFFIGPLLLMAGAYLFGNTVFILLQAVIVLAGLGGVLNLKPALLSWLTMLSAAAALAVLWQSGLVQADWGLTGPVGLALVALGIASAPRPASNHLLFWAGVPLFIFSIITHAWPFAVLNFLWGIVLLHTMLTKRPHS